LVAVAGVCGLLAGCGAASKPGAASPATRTGEALAFSECMRAHGVSGFPDPGATINGPANSIGAIQFPVSINMQSPVVTAAMKSCRPIISDILSPKGRPGVSSSMKAALIAQAQCMRTHGVPAFPDPTFPASGGIMVTGSSSVDQDSPAYKHAASLCHAH
jgi:hypothetical protein